MNGFISKNVVTGNLSTLAANIQSMSSTDLSAELLAETLDRFRDELVAAANRTALDALVIALDDTKPNQKIQLIKRVRELSGLGLREAKHAVEDLLPQALVRRIEDQFRELAVVNAQVSWNQTRLPDATLLNPQPTTSEERQDDKEAWNDEPPM